jgi:hypothetical protein
LGGAEEGEFAGEAVYLDLVSSFLDGEEGEQVDAYHCFLFLLQL